MVHAFNEVRILLGDTVPISVLVVVADGKDEPGHFNLHSRAQKHVLVNDLVFLVGRVRERPCHLKRSYIELSLLRGLLVLHVDIESGPFLGWLLLFDGLLLILLNIQVHTDHLLRELPNE